jgi:hypothetical protein
VKNVDAHKTMRGKDIDVLKRKKGTMRYEDAK